MSFSTTPKGADASAAAPTQPNAAQSARERAIAKMSAPEAPPQREAVPNPTQVSPEELGAIKPPEGSQEPLERQDNTTETPSEAASLETEVPKKTEEPISSQYAVLARKEKALRAKAQAQDSAYQQREAALAAREAAIKAKESEYQTGYIQKDRLTSDPWGTLSEAGLTYDQVTQSAVEHQAESPQTRAHFAKLNAKIAELEKANESVRQSQAEQQSQQYKQAVAQIRTDAASLVRSNEAYETIQATNSVDDVVELIERTFKEENVLMSIEDACKAVEDHLVEEALKIAKLKKIQSRLQPVAPATPAKQSQEASKQSQPMKTLTNAIGVPRQLSARERAILAMEGKLNKS